MKPNFASDNCSGVHPRIIARLARTAKCDALAYGQDTLTKLATKKIKAVFGSSCEVAFVFSGTGANVLALQCGLESFQSVICAVSSHINVDECGAPEKFTGSKLLTVPSRDGKLRTDAIAPFLVAKGNEHHSQPRLISITQSTEVGTVYSLQELKELTRFAHKHGLFVHVDGARLANAAVSLGCDLGELTRGAGIDLLSFGGTKNGLMFGEALIVFRRELATSLKYHRKQQGQLYSKMQFISAQYLEYMGSLWRENAKHANMMASTLSHGLKGLRKVQVVHPVQANAVFVQLPKVAIREMQKKFQFYVWNEELNEIRLMTSFNTSLQDVKQLVQTFGKISGEL